MRIVELCPSINLQTPRIVENEFYYLYPYTWVLTPYSFAEMLSLLGL